MTKSPFRKLDILFGFDNYSVPRKEANFTRCSEFLPLSAPVISKDLAYTQIVSGIALLLIRELLRIAVLDQYSVAVAIKRVT